MKKDLTEMVFILDRSGSMGGLEGDTIGGFNSMIEKQKQLGGELLVTTILFDNVSEMLHDRISVDKLAPMTRDDYYVRGCTALLDAVGGAIRHIADIHRYAREEDVPERTMFVITTDGMENASREYTREKVKKLIEKQRSEYGWESIFLGANIDAEETAEGIGISRERAATFFCDSEGVSGNYAEMSEVMCSFRKDQPIGKGWKTRIESRVR